VEIIITVKKIYFYRPVSFLNIRSYMPKNLNEKVPMEALLQIAQSWLVFGTGQK